MDKIDLGLLLNEVSISKIYKKKREGESYIRQFFMTDIHGDYNAMQLLINHVSFDPKKDHIVFGGDMIDRGKDSAKVLKSIKLLCEQHPDHVKAVIGNHEEMMSWYYQSALTDTMWLLHGGLNSLKSFNKTFNSNFEGKEVLNWACNLPIYVEDERFIYTHAGLDPLECIEKQSRNVLWMSEAQFYKFYKADILALTNGKSIIHGHTPVERIWFDGARMNCDMGSSSYQVIEERGLGLVDLTAMEYYVYKPFKNKIEHFRIRQH